MKKESLKLPQKRRQALAAHDLFTIIGGNPFLIKTAASFYKNIYVANDLIGVYEKLTED